MFEAATNASAGQARLCRTGLLLAADQLLDEACLRPGDVLELGAGWAGAPSPGQPDVGQGMRLGVSGGPGAGLIFPLRQGEQTLGRDQECDLSLGDKDKEISRRHLRIRVTGGSVSIEDAGSSNGTYVDGRRIKGPAVLTPGQLVEVGVSRLALMPGSAPDLELSSRADGCLDVRRAPRLHLPVPSVEIEWPQEPRKPQGRSIPLLAMLAPLVVGGMLWAVTRNATTLLFCVFTPVMAVTNLVSDHLSGRRRYRREFADYQRRLKQARQRLEDERLVEARRRREAYPDPANVLATATGPGRRLWERRRGAADFLVVRIGLAELGSGIHLMSPETVASTRQNASPVVCDVPATVTLTDVGVLGVAGSAPAVREMARWLIAQTAVASGPSDVRMVLLVADATAEQDWSWARWLPHVAPDQRWQAPGLGTTAETVLVRIRELADLVGQRQQVRQASRLSAVPNWPWVLVVLDAAHDLRALPGMDMVLADGPAVGVVAVCLESAENRLPVECQAVVALAGRCASLRRTGEPSIDSILVDGAAVAWSEKLARAIAPLRDPEGEPGGGVIPASVRLLDLLGVDATSPKAVAAAWQLSARSTSMPVGAGTDGTVSLDLRRDGPHGLVAGTTGSGKSEFLRTLVASLAVANRPDALTFLLIDYKGGAAFGDCAVLPHTIGLVTDLDTHLTERALRSLSAELKRREKVLAQAGGKDRATDIDEYLAAGETAGRLPRLVIVVDEFAKLKEELPEFLTGLVGIAQQGRSLGVHLILATQRPASSVSADIRANTNLRVALRVTSAAESADVIEAPDAVGIASDTPGRAYIRTGHTSLMLLQAGLVSCQARRQREVTAAAVEVIDTPWLHASRPPAAADDRPGPSPGRADSDLARLAAALTEAAGLLRIERAPSPWLPPLPRILPLALLPEPATSGGTGTRAAPFALVDLPARQEQVSVAFNLDTSRHLIVIGSPGSGRTTLLRTLSVSLAYGNSSADMWLYAVDCGGGELRALGTLPHTGAVITRAEPDRLERLLTRLRAEVGRRLDLLASASFADVAEQRAATRPADRLPYVVLFIDKWDAFLSAFGQVDGGRLVDDVVELAKEGGAAGLRLVVTGDRSLLVGKLSGAVDERICLNLADRADFTLADIDLRDVPPEMPPGRAIRSGDNAELHIAVLGTDPAGPQQAAAFAAIAGEIEQRFHDADNRPLRIDPLPAAIDRAAAQSLPGWRPAPMWAAVGVGGDDLATAGVDLSVHEPGFTIAGPRGSGRSTALMTMAESLLAGGNSILALCPRNSPLRALRGRPGIVAVLMGLEPLAEELVELLNNTPGPLAVLVDDAPLLHGRVAGELLNQQVQEGPDKGHTLIIAGVAADLMMPMRGFITEVRQSRTGLLLCPETYQNGEVLHVRLPRNAAFDRPRGRGILVADSQIALVQVPTGW